eukprot:PhF_6_TR1481/c0_g1_i2/m.2667
MKSLFYWKSIELYQARAQSAMLVRRDRETKHEQARNIKEKYDAVERENRTPHPYSRRAADNVPCVTFNFLEVGERSQRRKIMIEWERGINDMTFTESKEKMEIASRIRITNTLIQDTSLVEFQRRNAITTKESDERGKIMKQFLSITKVLKARRDLRAASQKRVKEEKWRKQMEGFRSEADSMVSKLSTKASVEVFGGNSPSENEDNDNPLTKTHPSPLPRPLSSFQHDASLNNTHSSSALYEADWVSPPKSQPMCKVPPPSQAVEDEPHWELEDKDLAFDMEDIYDVHQTLR